MAKKMNKDDAIKFAEKLAEKMKQKAAANPYKRNTITDTSYLGKPAENEAVMQAAREKAAAEKAEKNWENLKTGKAFGVNNRNMLLTSAETPRFDMTIPQSATDEWFYKSMQERQKQNQKKIDEYNEKYALRDKILKENGGARSIVPADFISADSVKPIAEPRDASFWDSTWRSVERSYYEQKLNQEYADMSMGLPNSVEQYEKILSDEKYNFKADTWYDTALSGVSNIIGQQAANFADEKTAVSGAAGAAVGAAAGGGLGSALTAPVGFGLGIKAGMTMNAVHAEMGAAYREMVENGISEDKATWIAMGVGGINGALEMVQMDELLKGVKILSKTNTSDDLMKKMAKAVAIKAGEVGVEVAQENMQEATTIAGTQIGGLIETGKPVYSLDEIIDRHKETTVDSALTFGLASVLSGGLRGGNDNDFSSRAERKITGIFDKNTGTKTSFATQEDVEQYIDYAYLYAEETNEKGNLEFPKQKSGIIIGKAEDRLIEDVKNTYDVDLSRAYHVLNDNDIRHIRNSHGENTNEKYPVTAEDLKKIPDIIKNYDDVIYLKRNGKSGVYYVKRHNGVTYYLEALNEKGTALSNKQMIKVSTGTIPDIPGLKEAINKKWNIASAPNDTNVPQMYVPDVKNDNAPVEAISDTAVHSDVTDANRNSLTNVMKPSSTINNISQNSGNVNGIKIEPLAWDSADYATVHPINASDSVNSISHSGENVNGIKKAGENFPATAANENISVTNADKSSPNVETSDTVNGNDSVISRMKEVPTNNIPQSGGNVKVAGVELGENGQRILSTIKPSGDSGAFQKAVSEYYKMGLSGIGFDKAREIIGADYTSSGETPHPPQAVPLPLKGKALSEIDARNKTMYDIMDELSLTYGEQRAILKYKGFDSYLINADLLNNNTLSDEQMSFVKTLNLALDKFPVYKGTAYRNIGFGTREEFEDFISKYGNSDVIKNPAFTSASKVADAYEIESPYRVYYEILSHNSKDVSNIGLVEENEVLFKTDSEFAVKSFKINGNVIKILWEEMADDGEKLRSSDGEIGNKGRSNGYTEQYGNIRTESIDNQKMDSVREGSEKLFGISREKSSGERERIRKSYSSDSVELRQSNRYVSASQGVLQRRDVGFGGLVEGLSEIDARRIHNAGLKDGARKRAGGVVASAEVRQKVGDKTVNALDRIAKKLHLIIDFADTLGNKNGHYENGRITIALDSDNPYIVVASHEITHHIKATAGKWAWERFQKMAVSYEAKKAGMSEDELIREKIRLYKDAGKAINKEDALEEIAADFTSEVFKNDKELEGFLARMSKESRENRNVIKKFFESIKTVLKEIGSLIPGADRATLENAIESFEKAYNSAVENSQKGKTVQNGKTMYQLKENLGQQLKDWMKGQGKKYGTYNGRYFELGTTPNVFIKHGAKELPIVMTEDCVLKVTGGKHAISTTEIAKLPIELNDPVLLFKSSYTDKKGNVHPAFVALTEMTDIHGNDVVVAIHLNKYQDRMTVNRIASLYSKSDDVTFENHIESYVNNQIKQGKLLDASTKKAPIWFTSRGLQLPKLVQTIIDANNNISQKDNIVNTNSTQNNEKYSSGGKSSVKGASNKDISERKNVDNGNGKRYNKNKKIRIPHNEAVQLREYIMHQNHNGEELREVGCKSVGDNFYVWHNDSKTDYTVTQKIKIDGNEEKIRFLRSGIDGVDGEGNRVSGMYKSFSERYGSGDRSRFDDQNGSTTRSDDSVSSRKSSGREIEFDRRGNIDESGGNIRNGGISKSSVKGASNADIAERNRRRQRLDEKIEEYGAIPKGEKPVRDISVPKKISDSEPVSRFARTMMEAGVTPDFAVSEFEERILDGTMTHEIITNTYALSEARRVIEQDGFAHTLDRWISLSESEKIGKNDLALGMELYNQCIANKDVHNAMKLAAELALEASRAGQVLQATRLLKLMSPDGELYYLERSVRKINDDFRKKLKDKHKDIKLNERLVEEFLYENDKELRNMVYDDICQDIADQMPSTFRTKWDAWRYLSMLGNLRTHIRNMAGNALFAVPVKVKNYVGAVLERSFQVKPENRTRAFKSTKAAREFAKNDFEEMKKVLQGDGGKLSIKGDIEEKQRVFKTKWLDALRRKNSELLEKEDLRFLEMHYKDALARSITAKKLDVDKITPDELERLRFFAVKEAQAATFREANELADGINKVKRNLEMNNSKFWRSVGFLAEGVFPFVKTPINIAKQGIDYSPVSILKGIYKAAAKLKNGEAEVYEVIDDLAKGLTGTALMMFGFFLARRGNLSGGEEEDKKKRTFDKMVGEQSYAFKVGDGSYTVDWMAPANLPLFVGVELYGLMKDDDLKFADVVDALSTISEPLLELSVFSGVNGVIESTQYNESQPLIGIGTEAVTSYVTQALPTIGGQISRIIDKNKREYYYNDKTKNIPSGLQTVIGQAASKIPFASYLFEQSVDEWGRDETYGETTERVLENIVSPGYYSKENYTEVDKEIQRLYEATGEGAVLPVIQSKKYTSGGVQTDLSASEYTKVKRLRGQKSFEIIQEIIKRDEYKLMDDAEKIKMIEQCYDYAGGLALYEVTDGEYEPYAKWILKCRDNAAALGMSEGEYIYYRNYYEKLEPVRSKYSDKIIKNKHELLREYMREMGYSFKTAEDFYDLVK